MPWFHRLLFLSFIASAAVAEELPAPEAIEASGAIFGNITLVKKNIFDLDDPDENKWLYRWANRLHVVTRDKVIEKQLLFKPGDPFTQRLLDETARILRNNRYLYDADVRPVSVTDGKVDIEVRTHDIWSLTPDVSFSRSGGENRTGLGIEETNLLGRGQLLRLKYIDNVDRNSTRLEFEDLHLGDSWVSMFLRLSENSDGHSNYLSVIRPFHALDARRSAGGIVLDDDRRTALYRLGNEASEFQQQREYATLFGGWSRGLRGKWTRRWSGGVVYDDNRFTPVSEPVLPAAEIPADRKLVYPFIAVEILEDNYVTASNTDQIGRTEDFLMGTRLAASVGWASDSMGSDRDALVYSASASRGFGSLQKNSLFLSATANGREENGKSANSIAMLDARFYAKRSEKRVFFATLSATKGHNLDLDNPVQLGGRSGLRGYPLRYQSGDSKMVLTVEQRYFTDWYPFRLFRVGGAVFVDVGRTWGDNPLGEQNYGWLRDVGFGLRFAPTRFNKAKVAHLDFAFPLDGDASIDDVQILLRTRKGF
jgi:outer membrane protein assembly factor BamA